MGHFSNRHSLLSLKDKFSAAVSQRRIRLDWKQIAEVPAAWGLDSQTEQITDGTSQRILFSLHQSGDTTKVDAGSQRLMGSCGKEMDGWVKWPGAARTEKGWAARRKRKRNYMSLGSNVKMLLRFSSRTCCWWGIKTPKPSKWWLKPERPNIKSLEEIQNIYF